MESQKFIINFVKIVERYPVLYDTKQPHRTPHLCSMTWEKVAEAVRNELHQQCAVDELKTKWKGIRSSFSRFKRKSERNKDKEGYKQYYLYESLQFLQPHTKNYGRSYSEAEIIDDKSSEGDDWGSEMLAEHNSLLIEDDFDQTNFSSASDSLPIPTKRLGYPAIKIEPTEKEQSLTDDNPLNLDKDASKRKSSSVSDATTSKTQKTDDSADLQFFKSILPDIDNFTKTEKRRFKMGVLKLIDDIEHSRRDICFN